MDTKQFESIIERLDRIYAILIIQSLENRDDKIYMLKQLGFGYRDIGPMVGMKDVSKTDGWKRA